MKNRLRHSVYWLAVAVGFVPAVITVAAERAGKWMERKYFKLRRWTHQDKYGRFDH